MKFREKSIVVEAVQFKDGNSGIPEAERGFPLCKKDEIEGRNMLLKGYGNAIVPELAAEFITAMEGK